MKACDGFEVMNIAGDYIAIPLADKIASFNGTVILNEVSAGIFKLLKKPSTLNDVVEWILKEYDIDRATAEHDIADALRKMIDLGMIEE